MMGPRGACDIIGQLAKPSSLGYLRSCLSRVKNESLKKTLTRVVRRLTREQITARLKDVPVEGDMQAVIGELVRTVRWRISSREEGEEALATCDLRATRLASGDRARIMQQFVLFSFAAEEGSMNLTMGLASNLRFSNRQKIDAALPFMVAMDSHHPVTSSGWDWPKRRGSWHSCPGRWF